MKFFKFLVYFLFYLVLHFSSVLSQRELTEDLIIQEEGEYIEDETQNHEHSVFNATKPESAEELYCKKAKVLAINKTNAKSVELVLEIDKPKYFGSMQITMRRCAQTQIPNGVDSKLYVTIEEKNIEEDPVLLFEGWLFSSSISLSTFSHPYYEIFARECVK